MSPLSILMTGAVEIPAAMAAAPSTEAERIATCGQGKELIVLTEMTNWYQVQDPATGMIGFISRQYVSRH